MQRSLIGDEYSLEDGQVAKARRMARVGRISKADLDEVEQNRRFSKIAGSIGDSLVKFSERHSDHSGSKSSVAFSAASSSRSSLAGFSGNFGKNKKKKLNRKKNEIMPD